MRAFLCILVALVHVCTQLPTHLWASVVAADACCVFAACRLLVAGCRVPADGRAVMLVVRRDGVCCFLTCYLFCRRVLSVLAFASLYSVVLSWGGVLFCFALEHYCYCGFVV